MSVRQTAADLEPVCSPFLHVIWVVLRNEL